MTAALPIIDVAPLARSDRAARAHTAAEIDAACCEFGFFAITGHGVDTALRHRLDALAREFFERPDADKAEIAMAHGGAAWRGWFPLGGELTSGRADQKEGLYFGSELPSTDPRVRARLPLHGPNLFPNTPAQLRSTVLEWIDTMAALAAQVLSGIALGLGLGDDWFTTNLTSDPTLLFRIFRYPPTSPGDAASNPWGVGEHTDYGLLTLLVHDGTPGLEVRTPDAQEWIEVPSDPELIVCNLGDMLDRMTEGRYRSTAHRVRNLADHDRLSFPFFYDPSWDAQVRPLPLTRDAVPDDRSTRWDGTSLRELSGTYGEYLLGKVAKVFPELLRSIR